MIDLTQRGHISGHLSLIVAVAAWLLLFSTPLFNSEVARAVVAVCCVAMMLLQFLTYRRTSSGTRFAFLTLVVVCFGLANLWLALNVVRFYTYDADRGSGVHIIVIRTQDGLAWITGALLAVISIWALFATVHWIGKRIAVASKVNVQK